MKRILILVLVVSLILNSYSISDCQALSSIPSEDPLVQVSYTSRDRAGTTVLQDGDTAWGDHVLINATYLVETEHVTESRLILLTDDGGNVTIPSTNRTVVYDTSLLGMNTTVDFRFQVFIENASSLVFQYYRIFLANYFKPHLIDISVSGSGIVKFLSWTVTDLNKDDSHVFDVFIRHHQNTRWWLWASNVTETAIPWDMTYYYMGQWRVRIETHDNDTGFRPATAFNETLWPALGDSMDSYPFEGGTMSFTGSIPGSNVSLIDGIYGSWYNYTEGETGNGLTWGKKVSMFDAHPDLSDSTYCIFRNGTLLMSGNISYGYISIDIDGLSIGVYNFTFFVTHKGYSAHDSVFVKVQPKQFSVPELTLEQLAAIVSVVAVVGVVFCCMKTEKK